MSKAKRREIALKSFDLLRDNESLTKVASKVSLPLSSLRDIIASDDLFAEYKKKKSEAIELQMLSSLQADLKRQNEIREKASHGSLTASIGMKWDKTHPQIQNAQQINIGDKAVTIEYPNWKKPEDKAE